MAAESASEGDFAPAASAASPSPSCMCNELHIWQEAPPSLPAAGWRTLGHLMLATSIYASTSSAVPALRLLPDQYKKLFIDQISLSADTCKSSRGQSTCPLESVALACFEFRNLNREILVIFPSLALARSLEVICRLRGSGVTGRPEGGGCRPERMGKRADDGEGGGRRGVGGSHAGLIGSTMEMRHDVWVNYLKTYQALSTSHD